MIYGLVSVTISTGLGAHQCASLRALIFASWPCWRCRSLPSPGHCSTCLSHGAMKCPQVLGPFLSGKNGFSNDPTSLVCKRQIYSNYIYIYINVHIYIYVYIHHYISLHHHFPLAKRKFFLGTLGSGRGVARGLPTSRSHRGECQGGKMPWFNHFLEIFWRFFEIF